MRLLAASVLLAGLLPAVYAAENRDSQIILAQDSSCYWVEECVRYESVCVPGCDPPDEKGTVKGCSDCYTREQQCAETGQVWFCPNM